MKRLIAFDLDDTLAITKSAITERMSGLLTRLLDHFEVCVITGGRFEQIKSQVVDHLGASGGQLARLHLMPTCGTRYLRYSVTEGQWVSQYAEDLTAGEKQRIKDVLESTARAQGLWPENPYGEVIEDRGSQISISFLGQLAPAEAKYRWSAAHGADRLRVRDAAAQALPDFELRAGGATTIDVTHVGVDKAYGMRKLMEALALEKDDIFFIGDKLDEGGNDWPVKSMGISTVAVERWEDTAIAIEAVLAAR